MTLERILADTSAWILSFRKAGNLELKEFLKSSILAGTATTSPPILLELLQGCKTVEEQDALRIKLESLDQLPVTPAVWERAYELGFSLKKKGVIVPTADLIIAATAIEHNCVVLHQDKHYEMIARHSILRTKQFR